MKNNQTFREAIRLSKTTNLSNRKIGRITGLSHNTISRYRVKLEKSNLNMSDINEMNDLEIMAVLKSTRGRINSVQMPDWSFVRGEMQFRHVSLQLLWEEYRLANPGNAYSYSQFTYYYRDYVRNLDLSMRQSHRAGETLYVDYMGRTLSYTDLKKGESRSVQLFLSAFGCSNYIFVYATHSQSIPDWIEAHNRMFQFYGGVPKFIVPDNLKSAVIRAGNPPVINRTYLEQSRHYGVFIHPARVRKPKDKSVAEGGVLIASRWIIAKLRHRRFFSLEEINEAISELLKQLNERPFKKLPGCRRSRFEELDKPMLNPLPSSEFEYAEWLSEKKVGKDYHLSIEDHYYSVPHELVGLKIETRITKNIVEFYLNGKRIASHLRSYVEGGTSTIKTHQPKEHLAYANLTPEILLEWAKKIGPSSTAAIKYQFESNEQLQPSKRSCATLKRLAKDYGVERFEAACERAQSIGSLSVKSIRSILKRRIAELPDIEMPIQINLPFHNNVRGSSYYEKRS